MNIIASLKKLMGGQKGHSEMVLCPFHEEKTPSCCLYFDKQVFLCFGCGKTGSLQEFKDYTDRLIDERMQSHAH